MKILLVYPQYPNTFWSFSHVLKFVSKKAAFPPLGLLTIASMLPSGWDKKLIDVNISRLTDADILWADMVFISAMIVQKESTKSIMKRCKSLGRPIIAGGPVFTTDHKQFSNVDHFILGEAEVTLPLFLKDLSQGRPKHIYKANKRPDISHTPPPLWSLINKKDYVTMAVQFSRGCPFDCEFCDIVIMNGRIPRTKTPQQMVREFQLLYKSGWKGSVFIVDDNFIGNKENVKKMLSLLIRWQKKHRYPFTFMTEASIDLADDKELMRMMSAANFNKVFLGLETPSLDGLKECNKYQNTSRDLFAAVNAIHDHGMQVMGGFIVGFDSDTEGIFESQIKFIQHIGVVTAMVGMLNALPQTRLWHRLKAEGRLLGDPTGENTEAYLNFIPKMDKQKLIEGYNQILSSIYHPKNYYKRINTFIKTYRPTAKSRLSLSQIKAFYRSMWRIGVRSRSRKYYWKLVVKTTFTKFKALPIAVELAIIGQHFEKVTKRINRFSRTY